jgi:hypothetical protein
LKVAPRLTATIWMDITSLTFVFIILIPFWAIPPSFGGRIAEPVAHGDHALNVPDPAVDLISGTSSCLSG